MRACVGKEKGSIDLLRPGWLLLFSTVHTLCCKVCHMFARQLYWRMG